VASAVRNGRYLISVVLKSTGKNIYSDTHKLLDYGFDNFNEVNLSFKNEFIKNIEIDNGSLNLVAGVTDKNLSTLIPKNSSDKIEKKINLPKTIEAPIKKGAVLGNIEYFLGGKSIGKVNVVSTVNVEKIPTTKIFTTFIFHNLWILILVLFSILLLRKIIKYNKRKRRKRRRNNYL
jgi:D-alanyl-D-alanine carboxypeptidase (penicillin-binding protein 5/6)